MTTHRFLIDQRSGSEPFGWTRTRLDMGRVESLRKASLDDTTDLDAAYELARLVKADLEAFGTSGGQILDDEEIAAAIRSLRAVLQRLDVTFDLPFQDFKSFKLYWKSQGMGGSYAPRQSYINGVFAPVLGRLDDYHPHLRQSGERARRITEVTRRRLRDGLAGEWWGGTLNAAQFLSRLYDLENLPSSDSRLTTAAQDIWRHCVDADDWRGEEDWIWTDDRFGLANDDEALLKFLAEMLHPTVRTDTAEIERLHASFNEKLRDDGYEIVQVDSISGAPVFAHRLIGTGVSGSMKNLFFASNGPKPEFVLGDAINNDVLIVKNERFCLVYDEPLGANGLTWGDLITWWRRRESIPDSTNDDDVGRALCHRLWASVHNDPERPQTLTPEQKVFRAYCELFPINGNGAGYPALLPQVYLHLDPTTRRERHGQDSLLGRERMDFLLLLSRGERIVVEVDGQQHYAHGKTAAPELYSKMVAEDRALRLKGYEVYRFGGHELTFGNAPALLRQFFTELIGRQR